MRIRYTGQATQVWREPVSLATEIHNPVDLVVHGQVGEPDFAGRDDDADEERRGPEEEQHQREDVENGWPKGRRRGDGAARHQPPVLSQEPPPQAALRLVSGEGGGGATACWRGGQVAAVHRLSAAKAARG